MNRFDNVLAGPLNLVDFLSNKEKYIGLPVYAHDADRVFILHDIVEVGSWRISLREGLSSTKQILVVITGNLTKAVYCGNESAPVLSMFKYVGLGLKAAIESEKDK